MPRQSPLTSSARGRAVLLVVTALLVAGVGACGSGDDMSGMDMSGDDQMHGQGDDMSGMDMSGGDGLAAAVDGYTLELSRPPSSDQATPVTLSITKDGTAVTKFTPEQTKLMHLYLVRSDLTGFRHLHPVMAADGTWSTEPLQVSAGDYRLYTQVVPGSATDPIVLSVPVSVPGAGAESTAPQPTATGTGTADGYTVTVAGAPRAGVSSELELAISRGAAPVTDLEPYLGTYAHVTAIRSGDLAFAHLHPEQDATAAHGGPELSLHADLPRSGAYRLFVQFQTDGELHTVPVQLTVA